MIPPREFIVRIRPFSLLTEEELDTILATLEVELFGKDHVLYDAGRVPPRVYLVFSGLIGLFDEDGAIDYLSKGELLGIVSIYGGPSASRAVALQDTVCYLLDPVVFRQVLDRNEGFSAFFSAILEKRFRCIRAVAPDGKIADESTFILDVEKIVYKDPVVCGRETSVGEAALEMERKGVSSIVVVDGEKRPAGILTHKDLRKVIIGGEKADRVDRFMSSPVKTVSRTSTIMDAYAAMVDAGIDHLVLTDTEGRACGVVTRKDIQVHLEPPFSIVKLYRKVLRASSVNELQTICRSLRLSVARIAMSAPSYFDLTRMLCSIHDAIVTRILRIVLNVADTLQFTWVHMGSSGRKEEIIATDQDNALISASGDWLGPAVQVNESLARVGFPKCPGGYMASNRKWNQPLQVWKEYLDRWFCDPVPEHVRFLSVFLDMRPLFGAVPLYEELLALIQRVRTHEAMRLLAYDAVQIEPPIGIFGIMGLHKGVDLKTCGIYPIVNGLRVLTLEEGLLQITNSRERMEALQERGVISSQMCHELLESYGFIQDLRLRHHARAILEEKEMDNTVRSRELSKLDLLLLKESLKVVSSFQKFLMKRYDVSRIVAFSPL
ncbi:MAG: CBS domain-containing protein [Deltaproteobacteria bacterium]|nr:CBS domain-containing protein [Deltaproteobacteria bacterium]